MSFCTLPVCVHCSHGTEYGLADVPNIVRSSYDIVRDCHPPARDTYRASSPIVELFFPRLTHHSAGTLLKIALCRARAAPCVCSSGSSRRRSVPYTCWSERRPRARQRRGWDCRMRRSPSRDFFDIPRKSRLARAGARRTVVGLPHLDVGPCPTRAGASAGTGAGGGAAGAAASGGREVAIFRFCTGVSGECEIMDLG